MPAPSFKEEQIHCSFCGKSKHDVERVIAGPGVFICNECVHLCVEILATLPPGPARQPAEDGSPETEIPWPDTMTDEQILDFLPRIATVSAQVDAGLQVWVERLRDRGVSWARIGEAMGMARQSAWERFAAEKS